MDGPSVLISSRGALALLLGESETAAREDQEQYSRQVGEDNGVDSMLAQMIPSGFQLLCVGFSLR